VFIRNGKIVGETDAAQGSVVSSSAGLDRKTNITLHADEL